MMCLGELINPLATCFSLVVFYEAVNLGIIDNDWIIIMNNHFFLDFSLKNVVSALLISFGVIFLVIFSLKGGMF